MLRAFAPLTSVLEGNRSRSQDDDDDRAGYDSVRARAADLALWTEQRGCALVAMRLPLHAVCPCASLVLSGTGSFFFQDTL